MGNTLRRNKVVSSTMAQVKQEHFDNLRTALKQVAPQWAEDKKEIKRRILETVSRQIDEKLSKLREGQGVGVFFDLYVMNPDSTFQGELSPRHSEDAKAWRVSVFERDNYKCAECGIGGRLNAHHIKPWAEYPDLRFDLSNGISLCVDCHAKRHPKQANLIRKARYHDPVV